MMVWKAMLLFLDEYTLCCGLAVNAGLSKSGERASGCLPVLYSVNRVHLRRVIALCAAAYNCRRSVIVCGDLPSL